MNRRLVVWAALAALVGFAQFALIPKVSAEEQPKAGDTHHVLVEVFASEG